MNTTRMSTALAASFDTAIRSVIVEVLDDAYQQAGARFDSDTGCNGFTFGTDLYHFVKFRFQGRGVGANAPITLGETLSDLELRLRVGPFNVACHRVGASSSENILECFPSSSGGPGRLARSNALQLELDLGFGGREPLPQNVVIAHFGNPENGLEAVYLAVPVSVSEAGKINAWAYTELVWQWDAASPAISSPADLPQAVPIEEATVTIRANVADAEDIS